MQIRSGAVRHPGRSPFARSVPQGKWRAEVEVGEVSDPNALE